MGCGMAGAIELARRHRLYGIAAWKQPALGSCRPPPGAQQFQQMWRQHHVPVFADLALLDADDHPLAVDVGNLERNHLGGAQTRSIGHAQRRLVLEPRRCIEKLRQLLRTEDEVSRASFSKLVSRIAGELGPCSACPSRSVAHISASTLSSAMTRVSVGPAVDRRKDDPRTAILEKQQADVYRARRFSDRSGRGRRMPATPYAW